jgi:hypothetical protein
MYFALHVDGSIFSKTKSCHSHSFSRTAELGMMEVGGVHFVSYISTNVI